VIEHRPLGTSGNPGVDLGFLLGPSVTSVDTVRIVAGQGLDEPAAETWRVLYVLSGLVEVTGSDDTGSRTLALEPEEAVQWAPGEQQASRALVDSLVVVVEASEQVPSARSL